MKAIIENIRSIRSASLDILGHTQVASRNGSGKSTLAMAIAAALTQSQVLLHGSLQKNAGESVTDGQKSAMVTLESASGSTTIKWPACKVTVTGQPPKSSRIAAGLTRISSERSIEMRSAIMADYLDGRPTLQDLMSSLDDLDPATVKAVFDAAEDKGWDASYKRFTDEAAQFKGEWRKITGKNWGSASSDSWRPSGFTKEMDNPNIHDIFPARIKAAQATLNQAVAGEAVSGEKIRALEEQASKQVTDIAGLANTIATLESKLKSWNNALESGKDPKSVLPLRAELQEIMAKQNTLAMKITNLDKSVTVMAPVPEIKTAPNGNAICPECKTSLFISGVRVSKATTPTPESVAEWQKLADDANARNEKNSATNALIAAEKRKHANELAELAKTERDLNSRIQNEISKAVSAAREEIKKIGDELLTAKTDHRFAIAENKRIESAKAELEKLKNVTPSSISVADAKAALDQAISQHQSFTDYHAAVAANENVKKHIRIADALAPDGVRKTKMMQGIDKFNEGLAQLSIPWGKPVAITPELTMTYGGRSYEHLSGSEQMKADVTLQMYCAKLDGSDLVVIDKADTLTNGWKELCTIIYNFPIPVMVFRAMPDKSGVASWASWSGGTAAAYWLEDGKLELVG